MNLFNPLSMNLLPTVCFGECMVELRPHEGKVGVWQQSYAGDTCNTAVYMARLLKGRHASRVCWAMGMGEDIFAQPMQNFLLEQGLDLSLLRRKPGGTTGMYAIQVDQHGERQFSYWRSASAARSYFEDAPEFDTPLERAIPQVQGLHFSGISLAVLDEAGRERLIESARQLRQRGAWVSFDTNFRLRLWSDEKTARDTMLAAMQVADRLLVSMDEWLVISGQTDELEAMAQLRQLNCAELVVKRGAGDTWLSLAGQDVIEVSVLSITQPVDTTGAGDAFAGAYLAARILKKTPAQAAAIGNQLAAIVVMHSGAIIDDKDMPVLEALA